MTKKIALLLNCRFPLKYFFNERNNSKLVADNGFFEEIVEIVARRCQNTNLSISHAIA